MFLRSLTVLMFLVTAASSVHALTVTLKAPDGNYLYALDGGGFLVGSQEEPDNYSLFEIMDQNGGRLMSGDKVCIKTYNGQFISAADGGGGPLWANSGTCGNWQKFRVISVGPSGRVKSGILRAPSRVAFRSDRGQYVVSKPDGKFEVTNRTIKADSVFHMELEQ